MEQVATISEAGSILAPGRPWWRLHLSTVLFLAPVVVVLAALIVPVDWRHYPALGWPRPFMTRTADANESPDLQIVHENIVETMQGWRAAVNWRLPTGARIVWSGVAADVGLALAILVPVAALLEWRRRRRHRLWQFTLGEGLALMLCAAAIAGWFAQAKHHRDVERLAIERLRPWLQSTEASYSDDGRHISSPENWPTYDGPEWLTRLVSVDQLGWFYRYERLDLVPYRSDRQPPSHAADLAVFRSLSRLGVARDALSAADVLVVVEAQRLSTLDLASCHVSAEQFEQLLKVSSLREVRLNRCSGNANDVIGRLDKRWDWTFSERSDELQFWRDRQEAQR